MRFGRKQNRFQEAAAEELHAGAALPPVHGGDAILDVDDQVTWEGAAPAKVRVFGATFTFDRELSLVRVGGAFYQLVTLDGRDCLVGLDVRAKPQGGSLDDPKQGR